MSKTLFLLDAYALIYRAHFAFSKNPRINSRGLNTSVPFGFTNTLLEILQKQRPSHIGVVFDTSAPTFRDEIFKEYKANRQETPEDIRYGIPKVKEIIRGFRIPVLEMDGYEADDIIGTLAKQAVKQGFTVYMMTPDKDFGQLVEEKILLYKPAFMGNAVDVMGPKEVCEKWDIENVNQVIDILGLQGDATDNIPGIPGFGPKTAAELIKQYGSVEGIIAHAAELKGKKKDLVEQYGEQALLSKKLATINTEVPVNFDEQALQMEDPDAEKLKPIFEELEFKTILTRVFGNTAGASGNTGALPARADKGSQLSMFGASAIEIAEPQEKKSFEAGANKYVWVENEAQAKNVVEKILSQAEVGMQWMLSEDQQIKAIAIAVSPGEVYLLGSDRLKALASVFANEQVAKIGHNLKELLLGLKHHQIEVSGVLFDTMIAHYLIEPESSHDLSVISNQYLNYQLLSEEADWKDQTCEQADIALQLRKKIVSELEKRRHVKLLQDVEMPLMQVLAAMEFEGVKLDVEALSKMSESLKNDSDQVQQEIYSLAGTEFNIASPKQLGEILFEKMKLIDKPKKTKTGQYATGEDVLMTLADEHAIAKKILEFREYEKLRSTYVDALPKMIDGRDGRVHTDYRQAVAATGRLSSNNPNLQNIPIRTEKGRQIRKAFVPRGAEFDFMSADYSQIELRIAASFAHDETMIEAFRNKRDIHATTAAKVFKVPVEKVTPDMRRKAKEVNFGILYGSTAFGLAQNLGISRSEASEIINSYFTEFPAIKRYMDDSINRAREKEYVETILGRRRYLRDINSRNITTRGFAERNAINAPIQGSAADIIKIAMVNIHRWLEREKLKTKMIMQVHDELVFDLHKSETDIVKPKVIELMKSAVFLSVPMEVEVGVGKNWLEAH